MSKLLAPLAAVLVLAGPAAAQTDYPDVLYLKFNNAAGWSVANYAVPGADSYVPQWVTGGVTGREFSTPASLWGCDFAAADWLKTGYPTDLSQDFTIECWVRTNIDHAGSLPCGTGQASWCPIERLWSDYSSGMSLFRCYVSFYNLGVSFLGGAMPALNPFVNPVAPGFVVADRQWHHIALVYDLDEVAGTGTLTSYVDGFVDQQVSGVPPGNSTGTGNFVLGGSYDGVSGFATGAPFNGSVDEFRWWSTARTQAQIQALMTTDLDPPTLQPFFFCDDRRRSWPMVVRFVDRSYSPAPDWITGWLWDFGDGTTSTERHPCHYYPGPGPGPNGEYTVSLTVYNAAHPGGITRTLVNYIVPEGQGYLADTCGDGDFYLADLAPPLGWSSGLTFVSLNTSGLFGRGWFFGVYPDVLTWTSLTTPAAVNNPFHFLNGGTGAFPYYPFVIPPGNLNGLAGLDLDVLMLYFDTIGNPLEMRDLVRITF